jgi:cobalt-zinc-cadmium efflux system outer membrane protein
MNRKTGTKSSGRLSASLIGFVASCLLSCFASGQKLTLEEAHSRFLERSPLVAAEKEKLEMARGKLRQSQAWTNPVLNYSQEGYPVGLPETTFDDQEFLVWASQEFELGGQRSKRRDLAQLELDAEDARYQDFLRRKRLELSQLFVRAYFSSKRMEFLEEALQGYSRLLETHRKRYEVGEVSGLAQMKIEAEELGYLIQLVRAEREFKSVWTELASMMAWEDADVPRFNLEESFDLEISDPSKLVSTALQSRPDLKSQQLDAQAAEAALEVEKARNIPNLNLGGGYKRDFGQHSFFVGVQLPLPLWDRRQGAIDLKLAESRSYKMLSNWKEILIRHEVERAYGVYSRLLGAARRIDSNFVQKLDNILQITALSYREGEAGILEFLDALRTQRDTSLEQIQLIEELHLAEMELEASVGIPLRNITP